MENEDLKIEDDTNYFIDNPYYKHIKSKKVELKCVECKHKFTTLQPLKPLASYKPTTSAFCPICSKKKCMRCDIILSRKYKCKNKICIVKFHGRPSEEMPDCYCSECIIYIKG